MGDGRPLLKRILVICGLSAVAFAAPVLDLYGKNPEVFVANRASALEVVMFGLLVVLVVPAFAGVVIWAASMFGERAATITYAVIVGVLALATGLVVSRQVETDSTLVVLLVALAVVAGVLLIHRWARSVLVVSAIALPVVFLIFLTTSNASALVSPAEEDVSVGGIVGNPVPVVMIQLDEMPLAGIVDTDGGINEALFPSFARLAREGTWYRNALSNSIATTQSIPAILSGRYGEKGLSPTSIDFPNNLFTLLGEQYEMHVIEWVLDMCPAEVCPDYAGRAPARFSSLLMDLGVVYAHLTMPPPLRDGLPAIDTTWAGFLGQEASPEGAPVDVPGLDLPESSRRADWVDWLQRLTNGIDGSGDPVLSYAHLQAPHVPWQTNPSGTHYERPEQYTEVEGVGGDGRWSTIPEDALLGLQRHLNQAGFLDKMLGRLFDKLDQTGTWDDTMVIVLADHGASFVPGEHRRWPYENNRDDLYRIPLFVKYPGQEAGSVVDAPAFGVDVLPTIVDVLDITTDWTFDGISLRDVEGTDRPHQVIWWCCSDEPVSTDLDILFSQVARNHQWIPDQSSWLGIAGTGDAAPLIGVPTASLPIHPADSLHWSLDLGSSLADVDRSSGIVQTLITGRISLPADTESEELLVAVNGRIGGSGYMTRDSPNGGTFRALLAEELIEDGPNEISLLLADGEGGWVSGSSGEITLSLIADDGHAIELQPEGSRRLQVDTAAMADDDLQLVGWSADVTRKLTPDMFYVFAGESLIAYGPPNLDNPNVVRWFESDDLLNSGFEFDISSDDLPAGVDQILVVAEFGDYAIGDPVRISR